MDKPLSAPFGWQPSVRHAHTVEGCTVGMGGKSRLRATLAPLIPEQDRPLRERKLQRYMEVFGGAGWLLLYKARWFSLEVYNDINEGLVNMFSVIRFHPDELTKELGYLIHSQKLFDYYRSNLHLTDIQKSAAPPSALWPSVQPSSVRLCRK